ncbi:hypothetical protein ACLESO_15380 [Pyxidicoccus sp. 3LG]
MKELERKCAPRVGGFFYVVMALLCLGPGRAAAELPLLSLPTKDRREFLSNVSGGTRAVGVGTYLAFPCTREVDGLAMEYRRGYKNSAGNFDAAYRLQFTSLTDSETEGFNAATQLGVHMHSATRMSTETGLGPVLGFSMSRRTSDVPWRRGFLEGFVGVQGAGIMSPSSARLEVPVRASLGLQGKVGNVNLMLVTRGGWDDVKLGAGNRPVVDATLAIGLWH